MRVERRDQHERAVQVLVDVGLVRFDTDRAVFVEHLARVGNQANRLEQIIDHDGFEHIQFEMPGRAAHIDRDVVADHLRRDHRHCLALSGVDFARHNGAARFVGRQKKFADSAAGSRSQHANIVRDFHQRTCNGLHDAGRLDNRVVRRQRFELIRRRDKGFAGQARDRFGRSFRELRMGIEAGADRGAAQGQRIKPLEAVVDPGQSVGQLLRVPGELLPECQRSGIHQMRSSDLDDVLELHRLLVEGIAKPGHHGNQPAMDLLNRGDMHRGRKGVVR